MTAIIDLVREDLRGFAGYKSARTETVGGEIWLNANEAAWGNAADPGARNRRYPDPQPQALVERLAGIYGCSPSQLLVGRGSDEAIDLLVRALCVPGRDAVVVTPPVFGMYSVCARLQNARLVEVPLVESDSALEVDLQAVACAAGQAGVKIVFLCSPSNPSGSSIALADIAALAQRLLGTALVVVDEAYGEYSRVESAVTLLGKHPNIAVLRTLSKAHALAAARVGSVIADPGLIAVLRRCQAPYPVPAPCAELAFRGLSDAALASTLEHVAVVKTERERVRHALTAMTGVTGVYRSDGNFLLARFSDATLAYRFLLDAGVVVRDQRAAPQLGDALRITIGTPQENDVMLRSLSRLGAAA